MVSVNFNRYGIALYSHKRLPPQEKCVLSICYQRQQTIQISALPARIRHRFETETGHQYGIEFVYHPEKDTQLSYQLLAIEAELSNDYDPENRYSFIDRH